MRVEVIEGIPPEELQKVLTGRKLLKACRKGKQMWFEMDGGVPALMLHFGADIHRHPFQSAPLHIEDFFSETIHDRSIPGVRPFASTEYILLNAPLHGQVQYPSPG